MSVCRVGGRVRLTWYVLNAEEIAMSGTDKLQNKAEELKGEVKEHVGGATGDESLQAAGKKDQFTGNLKQAGENVKDAFKS